MMDVLLTTIALLLPVLLGGAWLNLLVPAHTVTRPVFLASHGALLGLLLVPLFLWGLDRAGVPLSFPTTAALASALIAVALAVRRLRSPVAAEQVREASSFTALPAAGQLLFVMLLLLIAVRVATLGLEIAWRPLFPWDATMHWATKARVWFEYRAMLPFVDNQVWLNLGGEGVFTDRHPNYPPMIPLLQVWMNLAVERWDESLMNLPWVLCLAALGGAFYSQLRVSGVGAVMAISGTYLLLSMPLLNIHVALAGYADLFLGAVYCGGMMALYNWRANGQRWQGWLALAFALACPLVKNEGLLWLLTFIPAVLCSVRTSRKFSKLLLLIALGAALGITLAYKNPLVINQIINQVTQYHPDGLVGTVKTIWLHDNWHLFGYLLLAMLPMMLFLPEVRTRAYLAVIVALGCAVLLFLFLFLFTEFGAGAATFTGVGRLCIQLFPGLLFLATLLVNDLLNRGSAPQPT